jgi:hypothetical protein
MGTQQQQCTLEVWHFMSSMSRSVLRLVSNSTVQVILKEMRGNSHERWEKFRYKIGPIPRQFSLILEVVNKDAAPAIMALDNLQLVDCFDGNKRHSLSGYVCFILGNVLLHFARHFDYPGRVIYSDILQAPKQFSGKLLYFVEPSLNFPDM